MQGPKRKPTIYLRDPMLEQAVIEHANMIKRLAKSGCSHCSHPQYAGIRCGVCGRWADENTAEIKRYHKACQMALEALESHTTGSSSCSRDAAIDALREVLGVSK